MEKRKEVRLSIRGMKIKIDGCLCDIDNISPSGLKIKTSLNLQTQYHGTLQYNQDSVDITFNVLNKYTNGSVGCLMEKTQELNNFLEPFFNPRKLSSQLLPLDITNGISYEDQSNNCKFDFHFDTDKQISDICISFLDNQLKWKNDGWKSYTANQEDFFPDIHKISLVKDMVKNTRIFPTSFREWLEDLL